MHQSFYRVLGLPDGASQKQVKQAYRSLAKEFHPDRNPSPHANRRFIEITKAYEYLSNDRQKRAYDKLIKYAKEQKNAVDYQKIVREQRAKKRREQYKRQKAAAALKERIFNKKASLYVAGIGLFLIAFSLGLGWYMKYSEQQQVIRTQAMVTKHLDQAHLSLEEGNYIKCFDHLDSARFASMGFYDSFSGEMTREEELFFLNNSLASGQKKGYIKKILNVGVAACMKRDSVEAMKAIDFVMYRDDIKELGLTDGDAIYVVSGLLRIKNYRGMLEFIHFYLESEKTEPTKETDIYSAMALYNLGQKERAEAIVNDAVAFIFNSFKSTYGEGYMFLLSDENFSDHDINALMLQAQFNIDRKDYKKAIEQYEVIIAFRSKSAGVHEAYANLLLQANRKSKACEIWTKAKELGAESLEEKDQKFCK